MEERQSGYNRSPERDDIAVTLLGHRVPQVNHRDRQERRVATVVLIAGAGLAGAQVATGDALD